MLLCSKQVATTLEAPSGLGLRFVLPSQHEEENEWWMFMVFSMAMQERDLLKSTSKGDGPPSSQITEQDRYFHECQILN